MPIYASDEHLTRDVLNSLIESFCVENKTKYQTSITLNLEATFEDVAIFCDAFRKYNDQYTFKKNSSPDFAKVLEIWIHEIETKVNVYSPLKGDEEKYYSLLSDVYFRTTMVKQSQLGNVYNELFSQNYSDRKTNTEKMFVYKFLPEKLLEISQGFVYAHKLPELKKELIELSKEKIEQKGSTNEPVLAMPEKLIRFDNAGQKYLLLKELGIIDFIQDRIATLSNAKFSLLLAYITDTQNQKSFENALSQKDNVNSEHYPFKEKNVIKVTNILDQIGIQKQTKMPSIKISNKK